MMDNERRFPIEKISDERLRQAVTVLTTEHFTLQTARSNVTSEVNGRLTIFLGTVSSALIAIAFVGQIAQLGAAFHVFIFILLPATLLLGLATLGRAVQCNRQDLMYGAGINRIRHFYVELVPELSDYFVQPTHDDADGSAAAMGISWSPLQGFFSIPGVIGEINALIMGVLVSLLLSWVVGAPILLAALGGIAAGLITMVMQVMAGRKAMQRVARHLSPRFPTPKA